MALKYGDAVVLVQKSRDGSISRVNAIVLHAVTQPEGAETWEPHKVSSTKVLKGSNGQALRGGEYVDLAFANPGLVPDGQSLTTRNVEQIFRLAYAVSEWQDGQWIGWEDAFTKEDADHAEALIEVLSQSRDRLQEKCKELEAANAALNQKTEDPPPPDSGPAPAPAAAIKINGKSSKGSSS